MWFYLCIHQGYIFLPRCAFTRTSACTYAGHKVLYFFLIVSDTQFSKLRQRVACLASDSWTFLGLNYLIVVFKGDIAHVAQRGAPLLSSTIDNKQSLQRLSTIENFFFQAWSFSFPIDYFYCLKKVTYLTRSWTAYVSLQNITSQKFLWRNASLSICL